MKLTLKPNELIIRAGNSNLLLNGHKVFGKLIVTNQRIYFRALHKDHDQHNKEIMPAEISELHFFNTFLVFPNGMTIKTKKGDNILFRVCKRSEWAKIITRMY